MPGIPAMREEMVAWRRRLHEMPEIAFGEKRTAAFVAARLREFGIEVEEQIGGTGVVGSLTAGSGSRSIALRAELDGVSPGGHSSTSRALPRLEPSHACGHDGHMAMLLGAAKYLAETRQFDGTVRFLFQPAEESGLGVKSLIEDGLMAKAPFDAVFALHNVPQLPIGEVGIATGTAFAASDFLEVVLSGTGGHDALPHLRRNPIAAAASLVQELGRLTATRCSPHDVATVTVTGLVSVDDWNSVPDSAALHVVARSLKPALQQRLVALISDTASRVAALYECTVAVQGRLQYPATINDPAEAAYAAKAAQAVVGEAHVQIRIPPVMSAEDFGNLLKLRPGCYIMLGVGAPGQNNHMLHDASFEFNDDALPIGAGFWVSLVETRLAASSRDTRSERNGGTKMKGNVQ